MPENRDEEKNHYWSLRDIPKFEGKGEQPFSHLMEFEDYLIASGVRIEPEEDNAGRRAEVDYKDIINNSKHLIGCYLGVFSRLVCMRYHCTLHQTLYAWLMRGVWYWCGLESLIIGSYI